MMLRNSNVGKAFSILALLFSVFFLLVSSPAFAIPSQLPTSITVRGYEVSYLGSSFDGTNTTYSYKVCGTGSNPELSHFNIGVPVCTPGLELVSTEPTHAANQQVEPAPPYPTTKFKKDPTTGVYGVKFDFALKKNECRDYSITLSGLRGEGVTPVAVKAGPAVPDQVGELAGPACFAGAGQCMLDGGREARVVLMIDRSSSATLLDLYRQMGAVRALWVYFSSLSPRPYVAVGSYNVLTDKDPSTSARIDIPLTQNYGPAHPELNDVLLGMLSTGGGTDIGVAIEVARDHMVSLATGEPGYVVLMSDGVPNRPGSPNYISCDTCGCATAYQAAADAADTVDGAFFNSLGTVVAVHFNSTGFDCSGSGEPATGVNFLETDIATSPDWFFSGEPSLHSAMIDVGNKIVCEDGNACTINYCTPNGCVSEPVNPDQPDAVFGGDCAIDGLQGQCALGKFNIHCQCKQINFPEAESIAAGNCNDGIDNNCNGLTDAEEPRCQECISGTTVEVECQSGLPGECALGTQVNTCVDGFFQPGECVANVQPGQFLEQLGEGESCSDGVDNNCNGFTDGEEPACIPCVPGTTETVACSDTGFVGACSVGTQIRTCDNQGIWGDFSACTADILPGSQAESCNNIDDDCDGVVDNGFDLGAVCTVPGVGVCQLGGVLQCDENGGAICAPTAQSPESVFPTPEICDLLDNDCNGLVDDSPECEQLGQQTDCNGVVGGGAVVDQCGVCGGDGSSCLGCESFNIKEQQFSMDGLSFEQKAQVNSAARMLKRVGTKRARNIATKANKAAQLLYIENWNLTWTIPQVFASCSNSNLCLQSDHGDNLDQFDVNSKALNALLKQVVKANPNLKSKPNRRKQILAKGEKALADALNITASVPRVASSCS